jgi:hypothetical protein
MNGNYPRNVFSEHDLVVHNLVIAFSVGMVLSVDAKPRRPRQITVSWCHLMATLVGATIPVKVVDGYWCKKVEHSWIETRDGSIIDVSPIGCRSAPVMYPGSVLEDKELYWRDIFVPATKRQRPRFITIRKSIKFTRAFTESFEQSIQLREKLLNDYSRYAEKLRS